MDPEHAFGPGRESTPRPRRPPREVADELRQRIRSGALPLGTRLPAQAVLAAEFGVERATVRQALRTLAAEHLLSQVTRGRPAFVTGHPERVGAGVPAPPLPTTAALAPRITAAFAAPHVRVDALCLTAVSLTLALGEPLRQIHAGRLKPATIDVRVLVPSRSIPLAFPVPVEGRGRGGPDDAVHRRWLEMRNAQGQVLRHSLLSLRATHGIDVRVTFRALPFTPPVKLYLLGGEEALFAYYTVGRREEEIDHAPRPLYDAQGTRSVLFSFTAGAGPRDTAFVEQSRLWFDALWGTISSEAALTG
ncbi:winged helix-turn-helix domain-containing protein [Streptomyces andamanensis]|uniref:Winged helix-turn-helix domain-containing protein n=1 Tax=Streptomyces andamanensis TaxID=1565035 RepID=A0ABV8T9X9_9ACTN